MSRTGYRVLVAILSVGLAASSTLAHHSFNAEFDINKPMSMTGVLTQVEWINPHCYWHIDVKDEDGKVNNWKIEGFAPSELRVAKIGRDMVGHDGDTVTIEGFLAKDGTKHMGWAREIKFSDGREVYMGIKGDPTDPENKK